MTAPIRVVLIDDHGVVRRGLTAYLETFDDIEVCGEAAGGLEGIELVERLRPDVVLMDLVMSPLDGVETTRRLRERVPEVQVIVVTSFVDESRVRDALAAGASGYMLKDAQADELALAIRSAVRGGVMIDPAVTRGLMAGSWGNGADRSGVATLTGREREVLDLLADGLSNQDIADALHLSERTARTHVSAILRKLGLASRTQAAIVAVKLRGGASR